MKSSYKNIRLYVSSITILLSSFVYAEIPIANTGEGLPVIVSKIEDIIVTFQGSTSGTEYNNDLYLELPTESRFLFNNKTSSVGSTVNLGSFAPGTELKFRLHVNNTNTDFYTGAVNRNPDGEAHARVQSDWKENESLVSFEDGADFEYNDLSFSLTNVSTNNNGLCLSKATINKNLDIHVPSAIYTKEFGVEMNFWIDFEYVPNSNGELLFKVKHYGVNK